PRRSPTAVWRSFLNARLRRKNTATSRTRPAGSRSGPTDRGGSVLIWRHSVKKQRARGVHTRIVTGTATAYGNSAVTIEPNVISARFIITAAVNMALQVLMKPMASKVARIRAQLRPRHVSHANHRQHMTTIDARATNSAAIRSASASIETIHGGKMMTGSSSGSGSGAIWRKNRESRSYECRAKITISNSATAAPASISATAAFTARGRSRLRVVPDMTVEATRGRVH